MSTSLSLKAYTNPTVLAKAGMQILGGTTGLVVANLANKKANAQQGFLIPLTLFIGGAGGLLHFIVKPPKTKLGQFLQGTAVGATVVGGLKSIEYGTTQLSMNGLGRLRGFIPPEAVEKFKAIFPTINGMGELPPMSYGTDPMASMMGLGNYYSNNYYEPDPPSTVLTARPINGTVEAVDVISQVL